MSGLGQKRAGFAIMRAYILPLLVLMTTTAVILLQSLQLSAQQNMMKLSIALWFSTIGFSTIYTPVIWGTFLISFYFILITFWLTFIGSCLGWIGWLSFKFHISSLLFLLRPLLVELIVSLLGLAMAICSDDVFFFYHELSRTTFETMIICF